MKLHNKKAGRPKKTDGVIATLERMTDKSPCPDYLRDAANKYLRKDSFLPPQRGVKKQTSTEKLAQEGADILLMNVLRLDEALGGETDKLIGIVNGTLTEKDLQELLKKVSNDIDRRTQAYAYWQQRLPQLRTLLLEGRIDFRKQRLDDLLASGDDLPPSKESVPFALRAVRQLERIAQRERRGGLTVIDLIEQADAYLALGDLITAEDKAAHAVARDPKQPRAWFIRVVVALKQRNIAYAQVRRHRFEAVEIAEAMSPHERMLYELADEGEGEMSQYQARLDQLAPQALLHWPKASSHRYEHPEWRQQVCDVFVQQAFGKVALGGYLGHSNDAYVLNGMVPEISLKHDDPTRMAAFMHPRPDPLREDERTALALLFEEHARDRSIVLDVGDDFLARDFYLLHLRWVLEDPRYEWHWQAWSSDVTNWPPLLFENAVLNSDLPRPLWFGHEARHGGAEAAGRVLARLHERIRLEREARSRARQLDVCVMAFHHQLARKDLSGCWQTCLEAEVLAEASKDQNGKTVWGQHAHPYEPCIGIPAQHVVYWQYLRALCAVLAPCLGMTLNADADAMLAVVVQWRAIFQADDVCRWIFSEEYEGGGGEEYPIAPYDIDLCEESNWTTPTRGRYMIFEPVPVSISSYQSDRQV
jgi:hypothetical protein